MGRARAPPPSRRRAAPPSEPEYTALLELIAVLSNADSPPWNRLVTMTRWRPRGDEAREQNDAQGRTL
ncbi:Hypothetical predicted protein [Marmota monax]|uniref:Uncharacterized protein n=1 Tax=Marmota monax TaxID=9995 RepID=A0A5E4BIZ6_MARMO|nr:hypothetical protein GHT09_019419 [Marmota monax]VTJ69040.1 Hypothetical predicted protein [Marmota monax]